MQDNGMMAPYLASSLVTLFKPLNTSHFKILKVPNIISIDDFLLNTSIPVTLFSNMLFF